MKIKKVILSSEHRAMIRRIAKEQQASLLRISTQKVTSTIRKEFREEGYNTSTTEILEKVKEFLQMWEDVENRPEEFVSILDGINIAMIRHYMLQDYSEPGVAEFTRPIHRLLNMYDDLNQFLN